MLWVFTHLPPPKQVFLKLCLRAGQTCVSQMCCHSLSHSHPLSAFLSPLHPLKRKKKKQAITTKQSLSGLQFLVLFCLQLCFSPFFSLTVLSRKIWDLTHAGGRALRAQQNEDSACVELLWEGPQSASRLSGYTLRADRVKDMATNKQRIDLFFFSGQQFYKLILRDQFS